jgi:Ran GTPase-activating protein (RanGAP) involved in mRNA processing and transport
MIEAEKDTGKLIISIDKDTDEKLADDALEYASNALFNLEYLTLKGFSASEQRLNLIVKIIKNNPTLKFIDFGNCGLGDEGLNIIASALKICSNLETILLPNNNITSTGAKALCLLVEYHPLLANLVIGGNQIDGQGLKQLIPAFKKEPTFSTLKSLSLSGNPLGDEGLQWIRFWLTSWKIENNQQAPALKSLFLNNIQIGQDGLDAVIKILETNSQLTQIALTDNTLHNFDINGLLAILKTNNELQQISMDLEVFNLPELKALLANPPINSIAINKLRREAKDYYKAQAEEAYNASEYHKAEIYYKSALILDPYDNFTAMHLDKMRFELLARQSVMLIVQPNNSGYLAFINQLRIEHNQLAKRWEDYIAEAKNKDDYDLTSEGKHLRVLIATLQQIIHMQASYADHPDLFPLFQAIQKKDYHQLQILIRQGYDPNLPDTLGQTAMHYAALSKDKKMVENLVALGARAHFKNKQGLYPWGLLPTYDESTKAEEELKRYLQTLHNMHAKAAEAETRAFYLFKALDTDKLDANAHAMLKDKFKAVLADLKLLHEIYKRAESAYLGFGAIQQNIHELYATYKEVYSPLLEGKAKPACYNESVDYLKALENQLIKDCKELESRIREQGQTEPKREKELLGFYNQITKCVIDLIVLKDLSSEALQTAYNYFTTHINVPAPVVLDEIADAVHPPTTIVTSDTETIPEDKQESSPKQANINNDLTTELQKRRARIASEEGSQLTSDTSTSYAALISQTSAIYINPDAPTHQQVESRNDLNSTTMVLNNNLQIPKI